MRFWHSFSFTFISSDALKMRQAKSTGQTQTMNLWIHRFFYLVIKTCKLHYFDTRAYYHNIGFSISPQDRVIQYQMRWKHGRGAPRWARTRHLYRFRLRSPRRIPLGHREPFAFRDQNYSDSKTYNCNVIKSFMHRKLLFTKAQPAIIST